MTSQSDPYSPFSLPLPALPEASGGAVCFTFDEKWQPYILTLLKTLMIERTWADDQERSTGEASLLVEQFMTGSTCIDMDALPSTGDIILSAVAARTGWLLCDGSAISRATYADLFTAIGETFGAGNGTTTFNLPDLVDKFAAGAGVAEIGDEGGEATHTLTASEMPAHTHDHSHTHDHAHTHGIDHTHTMAHTHDIAHTHTVPVRSNSNQHQVAIQGTQDTGTLGNVTSSAASVSNSGAASNSTTSGPNNANSGSASTNTTGTPSTNATTSAGSDTPHNNLPPYVKLNYLIKT